MSTLRVSNIEAKADASSPTINEKVKITNSNGDVMLHLNGETSGITTVGINSTAATFTVDAEHNINFVGVVTATNGFSGNLTGNATGLSGSPTLSGITSISTTNLTVNGNAYPTSGPLSNRNLVINGAMQVAQRGTSSTTSGYGSVDRYFIQYTDGTVTHTQTAITSESPYDEGFRSVLRMTNTSASSAAGSIRSCFQYIEAQNLANSGWNYASSSSYVTLSFWVRSSVEQEFYGYLRTFDGTEQGYSFSLGTLTANTWTKVTKTIPGNSSITINNDNGAGLQVNISPFWGTDFTSAGNTLNAWGAFASGNRTPDYTNTWANTAGATFDITGVQLEVGTVATPFEHRSYGEELALCQRYFIRYNGGRLSPVYKRHDNQVNGVLMLPGPMRTNTPTMSVADDGFFTNFQGVLDSAPASFAGSAENRCATMNNYYFSCTSTWGSTHAFVPSWEAFDFSINAEL